LLLVPHVAEIFLRRIWIFRVFEYEGGQHKVLFGRAPDRPEGILCMIHILGDLQKPRVIRALGHGINRDAVARETDVT
jgi:hypothetical protein